MLVDDGTYLVLGVLVALASLVLMALGRLVVGALGLVEAGGSGMLVKLVVRRVPHVPMIVGVIRAAGMALRVAAALEAIETSGRVRLEAVSISRALASCSHSTFRHAHGLRYLQCARGVLDPQFAHGSW